MLSGTAFAQSPHGDSLTLNCAECHTSEGWNSIGDSISFDHSTTAFPLENSHETVNCKSCHSSLVFNEASNECASCHTDIHSMTVGNECASCHTTQNWLIDFIPELHEQNGFALVGSHSLASCIDCHISVNSLRFERIGNECINCHLDDFSATQQPNHQAVGFSTNCIECHDPFSNTWTSDIINHDFFPLEGGHAIDDCLKCHDVTDYSTLSPECTSCHLDDFNKTENPNHTEVDFSTNCIECHTIDDWSPSTYDHSKYPLHGAHALIVGDCDACHNGNYDNTPNTCIECHADDYNAAKDPDHKGLNFGTDCLECHTETSWKPATFDHDGKYFPIYSGKHNNEWNKCSECHTTSNDYSAFSCVDCHEHSDRARLARKHDEERDYVFESNACYKCHPDGSE
tara:strand:+ start:60210 stop:61409 length:1200 start_codon:yes stop_codon:yes gene_type:complete